MKITVPLQQIQVEQQLTHVGVSLQLNGKPAFFLIDTGASRSVVDAQRCLFFNIEPSTLPFDNKIVGIGSTQFEVSTGLIKSLSINGYELKKIPVILLDLTHLNQQLMEAGLTPMDGILGNDFLLASKAILNYKKFHLELYLTKKLHLLIRKSYEQKG